MMRQHAATHCNTLHISATRCNMMRQHAATHCNTLHISATRCNMMRQHAATHCNTLQHTANLCKSLQHDVPSPIHTEELEQLAATAKRERVRDLLQHQAHELVKEAERDKRHDKHDKVLYCVLMCCSTLQYVAVCCGGTRATINTTGSCSVL